MKETYLELTVETFAFDFAGLAVAVAYAKVALDEKDKVGLELETIFAAPLVAVGCAGYVVAAVDFVV